ncbi:MAG: MBL fold metallo-hydrolase, partial [Bacilli bacterium]|nr:MBL fold metallo-hydrolase [Bacilli bacterium]
IFLNTYNKRILIIIVLLLIVNKYKYLIDNNTYVIYFDVGQGDSSAIINKCDITLIDTGGKMNSSYLYTNNIMLYFKSIGCYKIKTIVTTHGDFDHMGETINLVNNFKVEKVIFNCGEYNDLERELIKVLDKKKIKYYSCIKKLNIDKNKLFFLQTKEYDNENDNSNVIYTDLDGYEFMFMGDASITTEKEILNKYNLPDIDVLKVGHHGSKTSSGKEFINEINPKYSIISVGINNRYGHPNKEVLENLKDSKIYRTDEDGSIMFKIKDNKLKIETCSP